MKQKILMLNVFIYLSNTDRDVISNLNRYRVLIIIESDNETIMDG